MNLFSTVLAQTNTGTIDLNTIGANVGVAKWTVQGLITGAITLLLGIAGLIFFFMLIIGGLKWILSGGDKAQTESARSQITAALIGLVIVFSAWAIATLINNLFGINIFNFTVPQFVT